MPFMFISAELALIDPVRLGFDGFDSFGSFYIYIGIMKWLADSVMQR
jgi:hypothetical protein